MKLRKKLKLIGDVIEAPSVVIECYGNEDAQKIFKYFTSRHPKLPLFRLKSFGAALRNVPVDPADIDKGRDLAAMRRKVRRAKKLGYSFRPITAIDHLDAILRINQSSIERQGGRLPGNYTDRDEVAAEMEWEGDWFGVFSRDNSLEAYAFAPVFGEAFVFWKILGNADLLDDGIVYLLIDGTLREMSARHQELGAPQWAMYDMYIGGGDGLREFKRRTGFAPYRVIWRWSDRT